MPTKRDTMEEGALICKTEKRAARYSDERLRDSIAGIDRAYTPYEHSSGSYESLQGLAVWFDLSFTWTFGIFVWLMGPLIQPVGHQQLELKRRIRCRIIRSSFRNRLPLKLTR